MNSRAIACLAYASEVLFTEDFGKYPEGCQLPAHWWSEGSTAVRIADRASLASHIGHGGSHPHLAHEFVGSIVEERKPYIDEIKAANWCAPGICAHQSRRDDGAEVSIRRF